MLQSRAYPLDSRVYRALREAEVQAILDLQDFCPDQVQGKDLKLVEKRLKTHLEVLDDIRNTMKKFDKVWRK